MVAIVLRPCLTRSSCAFILHCGLALPTCSVVLGRPAALSREQAPPGDHSRNTIGACPPFAPARTRSLPGAAIGDCGLGPAKALFSSTFHAYIHGAGASRIWR